MIPVTLPSQHFSKHHYIMMIVQVGCFYVTRYILCYMLPLNVCWFVYIYQDIERTRQVYTACLDILPLKKFSFSKIWIMLAHFEVRQKNLQAARKTLVRPHRILYCLEKLSFIHSRVTYSIFTHRIS